MYYMRFCLKIQIFVSFCSFFFYCCDIVFATSETDKNKVDKCGKMGKADEWERWGLGSVERTILRVVNNLSLFDFFFCLLYC